MVAYNGRYCNFKQFMPMKPVTHGIKLWTMACVVTKIVLRLQRYVEAWNEGFLSVPIHTCGSGVGVEPTLTKEMGNKHYMVVMDNFFTNPMLFDDFLKRRFYAVETICLGRLGYLSSMNMLAKGVCRAMQVHMHRGMEMDALHWHDTKGMYFLSTTTNPVQLYGVDVIKTSGGDKKSVPTSPIQLMYSKYMRGIDIQDQVWGSFSIQIYTKKWWYRFFFFYLDTTLTNAYLMHKKISIARGIQCMHH